MSTKVTAKEDPMGVWPTVERALEKEKPKCCLCLKTSRQLCQLVKQYGELWCCHSCLISAVRHAYDAACRFGGVTEE